MNKRKLHHYYVRFRAVSYWYFLAGFLLFGSISVYALRQNNLTMIRLRDAVVQADKDNGNVEAALRNLREYVYTHMNTNLSSGNNAIKPPIQLKYRYDRLVQAEKDRVAQANAQIYTDAQHHCEQLYPDSFSGGPRVPCITDYVNSHGITEQPIPDGLYKFDFVSPSWSPDLAGFSLIITAVFLVLFVASYGLDRWARTELKRHA